MSDFSEWTHDYSLPEDDPDYRDLNDEINDLIDDERENDDDADWND